MSESGPESGPDSGLDLMAAGQSVDPARAAVERADEVFKASQEYEITDPTVFIKSAALGALTQIELAKLARSKSKDEGIVSFARRMIVDHTSISKEMAGIARRKHLDVPTSLVYEDEQTIEEGAAQSAVTFDAWYARQMVTENQKALSLFRAASKMPDAQLAQFAKKTLPMLEAHRQAAMALARTARQ